VAGSRKVEVLAGIASSAPNSARLVSGIAVMVPRGRGVSAKCLNLVGGTGLEPVTPAV
jgi:hypothetical protein